MNDLVVAADTIIRLTQAETFERELELLKPYDITRSTNETSDDTRLTSEAQINLRTRVRNLRNMTSSLRKLNPILVNGILRVGGRLQHAPIDFETKHPVILPAHHFVTRLLVEHYHVCDGHIGLSQLATNIRQRYWILKGSSILKKVLQSCFKCRRWFANPCKQAMAPLPLDRVKTHLRRLRR